MNLWVSCAITLVCMYIELSLVLPQYPVLVSGSHPGCCVSTVPFPRLLLAETVSQTFPTFDDLGIPWRFLVRDFVKWCLSSLLSLFSSLCLSLHLSPSLSVPDSLCVSLSLCVCLGQRLMPGVFFDHSDFTFWDLHLELTRWLDFLTTEAQGCSGLSLYSTRLQIRDAVPVFYAYAGAQNSNSGPPSHTAGTLPAEPYPYP